MGENRGGVRVKEQDGGIGFVLGLKLLPLLQAVAVPVPSPEMEQHLPTVYNSLMSACQMGNGRSSQVTTQRKPGLDIRKDFLTAQALTGAQGSSVVPTPENVQRSGGGTKGAVG